MMNSRAVNVMGGGGGGEGGEHTQLRQPCDGARLGRGETGAYVCGVVLERCRRGNLGTLAATPCAMQRGSLADSTPVVVSLLARPPGASVFGKMYTRVMATASSVATRTLDTTDGRDQTTSSSLHGASCPACSTG
jgi:hypothetical protein